MSQPTADTKPIQTPGFTDLARYWGFVVAWMGVISVLSSDPFSAANTHRYIDPILRFCFPDLSPSGFVQAHSLVRKAAHVTEFFVLGALSYWASRRGRSPRWRWRWALQALVISGSFGLIDEAHQQFVASRTGSLVDSAIDFGGAVVSQIVVYLRSSVRR